MPNDPYVYPGTTVLINRLNIKDAKQLQEVEGTIYAAKTTEPLPKGNSDYTHLKAIHKHFFEDIYDWAGKERTVDIAKGDCYFAHTNYIAKTMDKVFSELKKENDLTDLKKDQEKFCQRLSYYFNEINAAHPFREGNGRTQRAFCTLLAEKVGYKLDWTTVDRDEYLQASIAGFSQADYAPMAKVFMQISHPIEQNLKNEASLTKPLTAAERYLLASEKLMQYEQKEAAKNIKEKELENEFER